MTFKRKPNKSMFVLISRWWYNVYPNYNVSPNCDDPYVIDDSGVDVIGVYPTFKEAFTAARTKHEYGVLVNEKIYENIEDHPILESFTDPGFRSQRVRDCRMSYVDDYPDDKYPPVCDFVYTIYELPVGKTPKEALGFYGNY